MSEKRIDYRLSLGESQLIKACAIAMMLIHHLFLDHQEYGEGVFCFAMASKVCVALFVFLSGYGMAMTFPKIRIDGWRAVKKSILFLGKRLIKFYMNYWVVFFLSIAIGSFFWGRTLEIAYGSNTNTFLCFIKDLFGLQGFESYNITWWFNKVILVLWLLFPFLFYAMKNAVISVLLLVFLFINPGDILYAFELVATCLSIYVLPFCIGIFMAQHSSRINRILNMVPIYVVLLCSACSTGTFMLLRGYPLIPSFSYFRVEPFLTVSFVLLVISVCRMTKCKFSFWQYVGKHSMNMYLTHTFIFAYFFSEFIYGFKHPLVIFGVLFLLTLLLSVCIEFFKRKLGFYKIETKISTVFTKDIQYN